MINCMTHGITNEPDCPECNGRKRILPNVELPVLTSPEEAAEIKAAVKAGRISFQEGWNDAVYGYCPICSAPGVTRERRMNGNDTCRSGHKYPSSSSKEENKNKPLPVFTPSWVERAREMIKDKDNITWSSVGYSGALKDLLKAEGYGV